MEYANKILETTKQVIIPKMLPEYYKGKAGRIACIGGSLEYSGAPYYSAISSLKTGCDISFILCQDHPATLTSIKSFSPELIVIGAIPHIDNNPAHLHQPTTDASSKSFIEKSAEGMMKAIESSAAKCTVIGPGLGRNEVTMDIIGNVIEILKKKNMPMVIDADGLFLLTKHPELIKNYENSIITPNEIEFLRLCRAVFDEETMKKISKMSEFEQVQELSKALGHVTVFKKGKTDIFGNGFDDVTEKGLHECSLIGSNRRCGGQGDILSGMLATFLYWSSWAMERFEEETGKKPPISYKEMLLHSCYSSSYLLRKCQESAFKKMHRGMSTPDVIEEIPQIFYEIFEKNSI